MAIILNIETTHEIGSIAISKDGNVLNEMVHEEQRDHAGWLQEAIGAILKAVNLTFSDLDAIAVTGGPGSYTGIRVGLASAKGLSYTLKIPMIQINTLELMVSAVQQRGIQKADNSTILYCPMIDARREEVWMGIFGEKGDVVVETAPYLLPEFDFNKYLTNSRILFFGTGADKYNYLLNMPKTEILLSFIYKASDMPILSENLYKSQKFTDLIYSEPYYLKEFYSNTLKR